MCTVHSACALCIVYMLAESRSSLPVSYMTSVCCSTANCRCGNTSANSRNYAIIIFDACLKKIRRILDPHYHMQTDVRFVSMSTRLLQLNSCWPSRVHHCAPTTRPECSGTSGVRFRPTWQNLCVSYIGYQSGSASCTSCAWWCTTSTPDLALAT